MNEKRDARVAPLPFGDHDTREVIRPLVDQLVAYRPGQKHLTKDMVMALLFAESQAREFVRRGVRPKRDVRPAYPSWAGDGRGGWPAAVRTGERGW